MAQRAIIHIDQEKCNGCGLCIPNCPEGALQVIDGKARLVSDLLCDGLGACIGHCPQDAITIEQRQAVPYDERKVMATIVPQGPLVIKAHLEHLASHQQQEFLAEAVAYLGEHGIANPLLPTSHASTQAQPGGCACPGTQARDLRTERPAASLPPAHAGEIPSQLQQWPVQLRLVSPLASYLNNADILIAADCVPFAYADFHRSLLQGKIVLVGCPKLDDVSIYRDKLVQIFIAHTVRSVTYAHMEVPCCFGLCAVIKEAIAESGKSIAFEEVVISIKGRRL